MQRTRAIENTLPALTVTRYALAAAGGVIGYIPLLTLLLPMKVNNFEGIDQYDVLAGCGVLGALTAGVANIAFGWLGDRSIARGGGRRRWLSWGLVATILSFAGIAVAEDAVTVIAAVMLFQFAINAPLAQVGALIAEEIPAGQKASTAALLTLGNPLAAGVSALVIAATANEGVRLAILALLMATCFLPLLFARAGPIEALELSVPMRIAMRRNLAVAWMARLLMQIAGSGVGLYLLFYFEEIVGKGGQIPAAVARLVFLGTMLPAPIAILLGRYSDRVGRRTPVLAGTAMLATLGLIGMAMARSWSEGAVSYIGFSSGMTIFLALNTGEVMVQLTNGTRRGRDLGLVNLANIIPQVIAPLLAWWTTTTQGFGVALSVLAILTLLAGFLPLLVGDDR